MTSGSTLDTRDLYANAVHRLGISVPLVDVTWAEDRPDASEPLNCYVMLTEDTAIFLDTGVKLMESEIVTALERLVGDRAIQIFPSRNEPDCIGNLGLLLGTDDATTLLFGGGGGILEWISDPAQDPLVDSSFLGIRSIVPAANGTSYRIGDFEFEWFDAPVKEMFLTQWAFERSTSTLFSSDFFGWSHQTDPSSDVAVTSVHALPSVADIAAEIPLRFNWIPGAQLDEVIDAYDDTFRSRRVDVIAPVHGCPIVGVDVATELIERTRAALLSLAAPTDSEGTHS